MREIAKSSKTVTVTVVPVVTAVNELCDAENVFRESQHLPSHYFFQAMNAGDSVANADHRPDFIDRNGLLVIFYLLAQNLADFIGVNFGHSCS